MPCIIYNYYRENRFCDLTRNFDLIGSGDFE